MKAEPAFLKFFRPDVTPFRWGAMRVRGAAGQSGSNKRGSGRVGAGQGGERRAAQRVERKVRHRRDTDRTDPQSLSATTVKINNAPPNM